DRRRRAGRVRGGGGAHGGGGAGTGRGRGPLRAHPRGRGARRRALPSAPTEAGRRPGPPGRPAAARPRARPDRLRERRLAPRLRPPAAPARWLAARRRAGPRSAALAGRGRRPGAPPPLAGPEPHQAGPMRRRGAVLLIVALIVGGAVAWTRLTAAPFPTVAAAPA